ncbi:MAG: hypothetical protein NTZ41_10630, partial [Sphingobacteriales bacterium]|nr:hypothetical protein [Sphingobacteriales bacterium]
VSGNFEINDSISISYVGYEKLNLKIEGQKITTRQLRLDRKLLKAVKVQACKSYENSEYSNLIADSSDRKFAGVSWLGASNSKLAVMLTPSVANGHLESISLWLKRDIASPKSSIQAPFKISFYEVIDSSGLPGELINNRQIVYFPKKEGKQVIQLDTLNLRLPENGIYLVFEYIVLDKYKWSFTYLDKEKGIDTTVIGFGARFDGVFAKQFLLAFYDYKTDHWFFPGNRDKTSADRIHGTIKFSARIRYCREKIP